MYSRSTLVGFVVALAGSAVVMLVVPAVLALPLAVGHAQYHAVFALAVLVPALVVARRGGSRPTMATAAPILGLAAVAVTQLAESIGALGYGPENDERVNGLVAFHDLGLAITPLGLVAAMVGVTIGLAVAVGRRTGRPMAAAAVAIAVLAIGGVGAAKLIGM
jgi:hypothetical protein